MHAAQASRWIPLGLAVLALLVASAAAWNVGVRQHKAEEEGPAVASRLLLKRGISPAGAVIVEGSLLSGYECRAVVRGALVTAKAPTPWKACVLMAHRAPAR